MAKKATIESRTQKAVVALQKYLKQSEDSDKAQLFEGEAEPVYISVTGKKYFSNARQLKPKKVELKHSVYGKKRPQTCIFVKDPQRAYKDVLQGAEENIVDRVVGVSKLKGKFKPYEARRSLKSQYDLFLAEEDVIKMLPKLLGKAFYGSQNSIPIGVRIRNGDTINATRATKEVEKLVNSTIFVIPGSSRLTIRVGSTDMTAKQISENVAAVLAEVEKNCEGGRDFLRTVVIKTRESPALPIYQTEELFTEQDIGDENDQDKPESEKSKRKREMQHLDSLLAEVVDEDEIKEYNQEQKRRRKPSAKPASEPQEDPEDNEDIQESKPASEPASEAESDSGSESLDESE